MILNDLQQTLAGRVLFKLAKLASRGWVSAQDIADDSQTMTLQQVKLGLASLPFSEYPSKRLLQTRRIDGVMFWRLNV